MLAPSSTSPLPEAVHWIAAVLTGSVATSTAVIAIAMIGFGFMQGHIAARRSAKAVLGCFIIFGAPTIGAALTGAGAVTSEAPPPRSDAVQPLPPPPPPASYDPYSGASVPPPR